MWFCQHTMCIYVYIHMMYTQHVYTSIIDIDLHAYVSKVFSRQNQRHWKSIHAHKFYTGNPRMCVQESSAVKGVCKRDQWQAWFKTWERSEYSIGVVHRNYVEKFKNNLRTGKIASSLDRSTNIETMIGVHSQVLNQFPCLSICVRQQGSLIQLSPSR